MESQQTLDDLTTDIQQLLSLFQRGNTVFDILNPGFVNNLEDCIRSAAIVVNDACTIVGSPLITGGSPGGSVLEMTLTDQQGAQTSWVPNIIPDVGDEMDETLLSMRDVLSLRPQSIHDPPERLMGDHTVLVPIGGSITEGQQNQGLQVDQESLIQTSWTLASMMYHAQEYAEAKVILKSLLNRTELKYGTSYQRRDEILHMLATTYCRLGEWEKVDDIVGDAQFTDKEAIIALLKERDRERGSGREIETHQDVDDDDGNLLPNAAVDEREQAEHQPPPITRTHKRRWYRRLFSWRRS
jgi:hypothetical protein